MIRTPSLRVLPLLALLLCTTSFAARYEAPPLVSAVKSNMQVSRHFAAGLEYLLVEPRGTTADAVLPMIVVLHGRGSRPVPPQRAYLDLDEPVRVVLPRGPLPHRSGYAWMPVSAHNGDSPALNGPLRERVRELSDAMSEWRDRHPTRGLPIVTGFSQGGILAATLAVTYPESLSRAFPMAGWIPEELTPTEYDRFERHVPMHALHGADDTVIGAARTRAQLIRLRALGYPVVYEEIEGAGHEPHPEMTERLRELIERALRELPETPGESGLS